MKKTIMRSLALVLALAMMLSMSALAVTEAEVEAAISGVTSVTVPETSSYKTITAATGATVEFTFDANKPEEVSVKYTDTANIVSGNHYLVAMVTKDAYSNYTPTESTIKYIDQVTGTAAGSIEFKIHPQSVQTSVILIYGLDENNESKELIAAVIEGKIVLGDVNNDGKINVKDILATVKLYLEVPITGTAIRDAADVNGDNKINIKDILLIVKWYLGTIDRFPIE